MSIVMSMRWPGVTVAQYDAVRREAAWEEDPPEGGIVHVAWFDDDGLVATDVWESAAQFDAFAGARLMPAVAKVGIETTPDVSVHEASVVQIEPRPSRVRCVVIDTTMPITLDMHTALEAEADFLKTPPIGGISHVGWVVDGGMRFVDVWRTVEDCERFVDTRLVPAMQTLGWPAGDDAGPAPRPVHAWFHAAN